MRMMLAKMTMVMVMMDVILTVMQCNEELLKRLEMAYEVSGGPLTGFSSLLVQPLLDDGSLHRHLHQLCEEYEKTSEVLTSTLRMRSDFFRIDKVPQGGYFVFAKLPGRYLMTMTAVKKRTIRIAMGYYAGLNSVDDVAAISSHL